MIFSKQPQILYSPMLASFGGGSANGFRSSGPKGDPNFNEHGIFGIEFPNTISGSNNEVTMSPVFTYNHTGLGYTEMSVRAQLLDGPSAGFDPLNASLVTAGNNGGNACNPARMHPSSGYDWSTVSSPGHISTTYIASNPEIGVGVYGAYAIGGALYTDDTSTQVIAKKIHYAPNSTNGGGQSSYALQKNSGGNYGAFTFTMPTSDNYHGRGVSTRFNRAHNSTERMLVNFSKDQNGFLENIGGIGGQPNVFQATPFDTSGGLIYPSNSQSAVARTSYNLGSANTHANNNRGAFLGGRKVGNTHESFFAGIYHDNTGANAQKGMRFIKVIQDLSSNGNGTTTQVGDHINLSVNANGGQIIYCNQVYPHAHFTISNHGTQYPEANHSSTIHIYTDLSQTWGTTHNSLAYSNYGISPGSHWSRVGNTKGGNPVYFYFNTSQAYIREHDPTGIGGAQWGTSYANTNAPANDTRVNGVFPIPETNRILVSNQLGFTLYEMNIP